MAQVKKKKIQKRLIVSSRTTMFIESHAIMSRFENPYYFISLGPV